MDRDEVTDAGIFQFAYWIEICVIGGTVIIIDQQKRLEDFLCANSQYPLGRRLIALSQVRPYLVVTAR